MLKICKNNIVVRKSAAVEAIVDRLDSEERERFEAGSWEARMAFERLCLSRQSEGLAEYYEKQFHMDGYLYR